MRAIVQRVIEASVTINKTVHSSIRDGMLVLVGIEDADAEEDIHWLSNKLINLRIFNDSAAVMNCSLIETSGEILLVSQFTLFASTKKGNRPSYIRASKAEVAVPLYENLIARLEKDLGKKIQTGLFGADMELKIVNDGPVTILIDTKNRE